MEQINWQPTLLGMNINNGKIYIDKANSSKSDVDIKHIIMLVDFDKLTDIETPKIKAKSIVKVFIINCKNGLIAPIVDLYFDVNLPTDKNEPIYIAKYKEDAQIQIKQHSALFLNACPFEV